MSKLSYYKQSYNVTGSNHWKDLIGDCFDYTDTRNNNYNQCSVSTFIITFSLLCTLLLGDESNQLVCLLHKHFKQRCDNLEIQVMKRRPVQVFKTFVISDKFLQIAISMTVRPPDCCAIK